MPAVEGVEPAARLGDESDVKDQDRLWIENRARELRSTMPKAEVILWSRLQNRGVDGYRFRRQYVVGRHILDFYCPQRRLDVEVDGDSHELTDGDEGRDAWLATRGIRVLRFDNSDVYRDLESVIYEIRRALIVVPGVRPRNRRIR